MEIALEFVEMPVRRAIEIGGKRCADVAVAIGNDPGRIVEHQRRAICHTDNDARMTRAAIGDDDRSALANSPDFRQSFR